MWLADREGWWAWNSQVERPGRQLCLWLWSSVPEAGIWVFRFVWESMAKGVRSSCGLRAVPSSDCGVLAAPSAPPAVLGAAESGLLTDSVVSAPPARLRHTR